MTAEWIDEINTSEYEENEEEIDVDCGIVCLILYIVCCHSVF